MSRHLEPVSPVSETNGKKRRSLEDIADYDPATANTKRSKAAPKKHRIAKLTEDIPARPASTRPTRNRRAPARYSDLKDPAKEKSEPKPNKPAPRTLNTDHLLSHPKSRLVRADLIHLLAEPSAWDVLSPEDQSAIISTLPGTSANMNLLAKLIDGANGVDRPLQFGVNCTVFRTDVRKFQEDLSNGYFGKRWQEEAHVAMVARAEGAFDNWKLEESERWWGQKMG
ncbi:hypothetical protein K469DRAFT_201651 [Zopfia rhizophila CBS 207.26]|uniref:ASX DEUBAD domain-containing protein n=1 Tax=Zopfia rhizophila CBS 207.26 TaxID=1314779 RepID=A0A6A6DVW1_9PEZI|nr:hypothetical protein K469DRAFT_201651 [Zopfia rhizophila CBS 207.26]